ncbi:GerAB/ArcD/ProY family transporter [Bacillus mangrovi]|uniref:GerAB/ArcD/ProY family transporter n=1 Tax=Metabacillus mangrovi TaxID=1491830 RepID=A0A7X2V481_9BACI|nr:GerAB/ArcD/ProY family transporter [Metabacillus mangrovi]MTH53472.1 GerAB/ArcD/ProY family transporter [Metabacillus mangrovi]
MQRVSGKELFYLIFIYEIGSAILLDPAKGAMKDAWLAILLGFLAAIPLLLMYIALTKVSGKKTLTGILIFLLGKKAGSLVSFLYILYFLYICSRVLRDFGELLIITAYNETFLIVISSFMMLTAMYFSIKPFKVIASAAAPMFYWITIPFVLVVMFEFMSGIVDVKEILPVAEHGPMPILKTIFPTVLTFPFGEMVVFTMFYPLAEKGVRYIRITLLSVLASVFVLSLTAFLHTAILGAKLTKNFIFPILATVSLINISDFIQRLDSLIVILMIVVGFIKVLLFFFAAVKGTCEVTGTKNKVPVSVIYGIAIIFASLFIASTQYEHFQEGLSIVPLFLHVPFQIVIPALLLLGLWLKKKRKGSKHETFKEA